MKKLNLERAVVLSVGILATVLLVNFLVFAWSEPPYGGTCTTPPCPPEGNVPAPINVGGAGQTKKYIDDSNTGWLGIATDNYDSNYGLTVGNSTNLLGIKTSGDSLFEGNLSLKELSSAPGPTSDYGKIYVKTDGSLYFKNDAGTEFNLSVPVIGGSTLVNYGNNDNNVYSVSPCPGGWTQAGLGYGPPGWSTSMFVAYRTCFRTDRACSTLVNYGYKDNTGFYVSPCPGGWTEAGSGFGPPGWSMAPTVFAAWRTCFKCF